MSGKLLMRGRAWPEGYGERWENGGDDKSCKVCLRRETLQEGFGVCWKVGGEEQGSEGWGEDWHKLGLERGRSRWMGVGNGWDACSGVWCCLGGLRGMCCCERWFCDVCWHCG